MPPEQLTDHRQQRAERFLAAIALKGYLVFPSRQVIEWSHETAENACDQLVQTLYDAAQIEPLEVVLEDDGSMTVRPYTRPN